MWICWSSLDRLIKPGNICTHTYTLCASVCSLLLKSALFIREVLERAIHLKLNAKKMKLMFKKYMEFERQYGTPAGVEVVKDKARTYVEAQQET